MIAGPPRPSSVARSPSPSCPSIAADGSDEGGGLLHDGGELVCLDLVGQTRTRRQRSLDMPFHRPPAGAQAEKAKLYCASTGRWTQSLSADGKRLHAFVKNYRMGLRRSTYTEYVQRCSES